MYTNKGQFNIEANGDIGFTIEGEYSKLKDIAGKWNVKNNIAETFILQQNLNAKKNGEANRSFYRDDIKNLYTNSFKQTGPEGIMVTAKTDLTGDNEYILSNGQKAGNLSFESMWSQGLLDKKFYEQIPKGTDSKWMYDRKNSLILNDLIAEYYTDVTKYSFDEGNKNYKSKINNNNTKPGNFIIGGQTFNARDFNNSFVPFINKLAKPSEGELFVSPTGMKFKYEKNNYYVYDANTRKIDKDNPMKFKDVAVLDGWANYIDFSKPKPE
jgi:hypothetical protein